MIVFDDGGGDNAVWVYGCMCRLIACFGSPAFVHVCVCVCVVVVDGTVVWGRARGRVLLCERMQGVMMVLRHHHGCRGWGRSYTWLG